MNKLQLYFLGQYDSLHLYFCAAIIMEGNHTLTDNLVTRCYSEEQDYSPAVDLRYMDKNSGLSII